MNTENAAQVRGRNLDKPKKIPRVRVVMNAKELSPNWADHEVYSTYRRTRIKFADSPSNSQSTYLSEGDSDRGSNSENSECTSEKSSDENSDVMSLDGEVDRRDEEEFPKAPDRINTIIHEWGKGTTCELRWGFKQDQKYDSKGEVVKRTEKRDGETQSGI